MNKAFLAIVALHPLMLNAQGTFLNFGFENPTFIATNFNGTSGEVQFQPAFPGWTGYFGANIAFVALSNNLTVGGGASISILGPSYPDLHLEGNYTAVLHPGGTQLGADVTLSQTGLIPPDAKSLHYLAFDFYNRCVVTVNGQQLNVSALQGFGSYSEFGADISAFAGQAVDLRFTQPNVLGSPSSLYLDAISFSSVGIPEPSTIGLSALGALLLGWFRWKRNRSGPT